MRPKVSIAFCLGRNASVQAPRLEFLLLKLGLQYCSSSTDIEAAEKRRVMEGIFAWHSKQLDDRDTLYHVMDPVVTAVSILI